MDKYNYKNIPIFCSEGVHEKIFESFLILNLPKDIKILILGSGAGSMEKRLLDYEYKNITSVDINNKNFLIKNVNFLQLDLNKDFSYLGKYDIIFAIEIIEHLENPFHFIRNIAKIMKLNSVFFLTTPNVENSFSKIKYFVGGYLHWFSRLDLTESGHITPIFDYIFFYNLKKNNLKIKNYSFNINIYKKLLKTKNIFKKIIFIFLFLFSFVFFRKKDGEIKLLEIVKE